MKEYLIEYKGTLYSNLKYFFIGNHIEPITIEKVPFSIDYISNFYETEEELILEMGERIIDITEGKLLITDNYNNKIIFNKKSFRAEGQKFEKNILHFISKDSLESRYSIIEFLSKIITLNNNISEHLDTKPDYILKNKNETFIKNFLNLIVFNFPEFEKFITSDNIKFLKDNLNKDCFEVSEANKLYQVVGVPKFVLNDLKELKLDFLIDSFKNLTEVLDGNSLKIILYFLENMQIVYTTNYKPNIRQEKLISFSRYLYKICKRKIYKITDLINYLLRQSMYSSANGYFSFPHDEVMYLSDYLDMCDKYDISYEKYPSQLKRIHDIVAKNIAILERKSEDVSKEFADAVNNYAFVEMDLDGFKIEKDNKVKTTYVFIVPKNVKDIIEEGNSLHHCVGSYSDKIINKESRIVFMRYKDAVKESLVTIDIDEHFNLVEAKKAFNEDVDDEQDKVIKKWIKEIKKKGVVS